jgi:hypothetical protein
MKQPKNEVLPSTLNLMALNSITGAAREQFAAEEGTGGRYQKLRLETSPPRPVGSSRRHCRSNTGIAIGVSLQKWVVE